MMSEKVVLIAGASTGIGEAMAIHLASVGYTKLALVARRAEMLEEVAKKCRAKGATQVLVLPRDLASPESPEDIINEVIKEFSRLDILICNAATLGELAPVSHQTAENFDAVMSLNVRSPMLLSRFALPHLVRVKGNILYISSSLASRSKEATGVYSCSKAALNSLAKTVALENGKLGIRANILTAGPVATDMLRTIMQQTASSGKSEGERGAKLPLGRVGNPLDLAKMAAFLISEDNSNMTGAEIVCDGGHLIC